MSPAEESGERRGLLPRFTLKDGFTFLLADALGDIQGSDDGLFTNDTRMLSRFELQVAGRRASLLGAAINQDNTRFTSHLTNLPLPALGEGSIPQGAIHIERSHFVCDSTLHGQLRLTNFSEERARVPLKFCFAADFVDIFEVQGHIRKTRGDYLPASIAESSVRLAYQGRDARLRTTHVRFSQAPLAISAAEAEFVIELGRGASAELYIEIEAQTVGEASQPGSECGHAASTASRARFEAAAGQLGRSMGERLAQGASLSSSGRLFNQWIDKSRSDLALLTTPLATGPYPFAGIPWFATQFGRDAIITALQTLWINPQLAAGVLRFLASTQAQENSAFRDSQPGKIMHETRRGEMATLREVPFGQYYGGVDTTPLFVLLAGAYESRTGDRTIVDRIWPAVLAATAWIEQRMDNSPTGFLDYARGEKTGLVNQSWKDSNDSIFHADGRFPKGPVAVVEVQGYAFAAFQAAAEMARVRGEEARAATWGQRAQKLREAIEENFWVPEMNFYAIALDADGGTCKVRASNAGHLLFCGVPAAERAARVAQQLLGQDFASGWGIRTLAAGQARFNPMSYHNGSIWPHDVAICAAGMARYGGAQQILPIVSDLFEAANHFNMRLPELYCGFERVPGQGPAPYPVACLPQAWSSACVFLMLQAALGIRIDGWHREVHIEHPLLPVGVDTLAIRDLPVGDRTIDLEFHRIGAEVAAVPARHIEGGIRVLAHL
jgi:glycogen debranching enzyme